MITSFFKPKRDRAAAGKENDGKKTTAIATTTEPKKRKTTHEATATTKATTTIAITAEASELIRHLHTTTTTTADSVTVSSWKVALGKHFASPSFGRLASFVDRERSQKTVFPPVEDTFAALNLCPLSETRLVIVGQDPYHGPRQAHGLCFSVRRGIPVPPSLRNIYKELHSDADVPNFSSVPNHGNLERWARQGVLMINNVLTVRKGEAHSHKKKGWEEFTDEIIRAVDRRTKQNTVNGGGGGRGVVFLLWGKPATEKAKTALAGISSRHKIICTSHPSPLGATKTNAPFTGSKCFSRANRALRELGYDEIDWRVDGAL
eukprot:jgi/Psemu1/294134/fgenesh1_pm.8_\